MTVVTLRLAACAQPDGQPGPGDRGEAGSPETTGLVGATGGSYARITPSELRRALDRGEDPLVVNTHVPFEGNIPGTDLSVSYDETGTEPDRLPEGKDAPIIVYCKSGRMSDEAAGKLVRLGYTGARDLEGGMRFRRKAGSPLEGH